MLVDVLAATWAHDEVEIHHPFVSHDGSGQPLGQAGQLPVQVGEVAKLRLMQSYLLPSGVEPVSGIKDSSSHLGDLVARLDRAACLQLACLVMKLKQTCVLGSELRTEFFWLAECCAGQELTDDLGLAFRGTNRKIDPAKVSGEVGQLFVVEPVRDLEYPPTFQVPEGISMPEDLGVEVVAGHDAVEEPVIDRDWREFVRRLATCPRYRDDWERKLREQELPVATLTGRGKAHREPGPSSAA